jgi:hypothetical protein
MKKLIDISINSTISPIILAEAQSMGKTVGTREARRANLYLVAPNGVRDYIITFDQTFPTPYAFLIASIRWSETEGKYMTVINELVELDAKKELFTAIQLGLSQGKIAYEEANKTIDSIEGLKDRILMEANSAFSRKAWFATEEDAKLWGAVEAGTSNVWTAEFVSFEHDAMVHEIIGEITKKEGKSLDGLWMTKITGAAV